MTRVRLVVCSALLVISLGGTAAAADGTEGTETAGGGFAPAPAAGGGTGFGAQGQFVASMGLSTQEHLFFHKQSGGGWQLGIQPALDYFVVPRLSVGGLVGYVHSSGGAGTGANSNGADVVAVAGRAGFNLDITDKVGFWPLGGLSVQYQSVNHSSSTNTWLNLYAPFLFHPAPHFFVGAGPSFLFNLSGPMANQYGIDSFLGGWL
jgi:hypothetical protein